MINAVLFDAGDVLYRRRRDYRPLTDFLAQYGLQPPDYTDPELKRLREDAYAGRITRDDLFDTILRRCGLHDTGRRVEGRRILDEAQAAIDFFPGVAETLLDLKMAGLRLGVVTNTFDSTETKLRWFRAVGIDHLWDSFATSCELGLLKPNPGLYLAALAPLDVYPADAAFVGHAQSELVGAKRLGFTTVAFNRDNDDVEADEVVVALPELAHLVRKSRMA